MVCVRVRVLDISTDLILAVSARGLERSDEYLTENCCEYKEISDFRSTISDWFIYRFFDLKS